MATIKQIKEQQDAIKSIHKITRAMELVATAKSQRAIRDLNSYQSYFQKTQNIVEKIAKENVSDQELKGTYWIVLMSDLGLAGSYNSKLIKEIISEVSPTDKILVIGQKGSILHSKIANKIEIMPLEVLHDYIGLGDLQVKIQSVYRDDHLKVKVLFTKFISQLEFEPKIEQILPIQVDTSQVEEEKKNIVLLEFEPSREILLREIEDIYIQSVVQGFYREAQASENTARRTAMENATRNGDDMLRDLNIVYNRTRQAKITQEISEIIGGAEALK